MDIDLECLKKLAKNATPGPWEFSGKYGCFSIRIATHHGSIIRGGANTTNEMDCPNMAYIAAISPDVLLALIVEIERLKGLCKWDVGVLQALGILPKNTRDEDMTPDLRDAAMQKLHDMEFKKLKRLEDEADWLAEYGAGKEQCPFFEFQYGDAEPIPDWCEGSETVEDGFDCPNDPVECWRKVAREAVETSSA